jgi:hypothetical protein
MDMGVFLAALWFILVPYYLWHYERWHGLAKGIGLVGVYFLSWYWAVWLVRLCREAFSWTMILMD